MKNMKSLSVLEKREILTNILSKGKFANVKWVSKKNGDESRSVKMFIERLFTSGDKNDVQANPVAHKTNLFSCVDATNYKWVNINLETLKEIKCGDNHYVFEGE